VRPIAEAVFVGLVVLVTSWSGIWFLGYQSLSAQKGTIREHMLRMVNAAAGLVDGDLHGKLADPSQQGGEDYERALAPLVAFHRGVPEIAYLYTLVEKNGRLCFVLDTATAADRLGFSRKMVASGLMEPYQSRSAEEDRAEMEALREGGSYVSKEPFTDEFGTFLTALAPVKTRDGRNVGAVGLDLDVADYLAQLRSVILSVAVSSGFALFAALLVSGFVFRSRQRLRHQEETTRKVSEEKMAAEELDRRLVSALGQMIYHYNAADGRMLWRGECRALLGFEPGEMPSAPGHWKDRIHPKDAAALEDWAGARDGSDSLLVREYRCLHREGHSVWFLDRCVLTRGPDGKLLAADGVLLDISRQKKFEADLISSRDAAEAADRAKSDFLAVMSHEIRTPMNGVIGCATLLLDTAINAEQKDYLHTIRKCGDSLLHLINDILDFSKMESSKLTLEKRPFSLRNCAEEVLDLYALMAAEKKIELLARFECPDLDWMAGDEGRLRQILVNLVGNALKFTASGEVVVTLGRRPWLPGGDALMLSVRDTGIGISGSEQKRIFLPFSQADSSTTRRFGGTGLGLAICGRLAALMGGAITVHSEEGRGAEFVVLIPLDEAAEKNVQPAGGPLAGRSVLIVDDSAPFRQMAREVLESFGMNAALAGDVPAVREALGSGVPPDVALVDGGLPDAVLTDVAAALASANIPHVLELAFPSIVRVPQSASLRLAGTIAKPVRRAELLKALTRLFEPRAADDMPEAAPSPGLLADRFPLKILIAEDNAINRKVLTKMLGNLGYHPQVVENGKLCVERLESESFDLVVMDIQMPEMDGYEATAVLRQRGDTTWITALTADAMPEDPLRCRIAGMNDYLSKPLRSEALRSAIERCAIARQKLRVG